MGSFRRRRARDAACGLGVVKGVSWSVFLCLLMGVAQVTAFIRTRGVDSRANKMPVSRGVHTPHVEYVPSSEFAWGPKGEWSKQSAEDQDFESQYQETSTVEGYDGRIDHLRLKNHEVRLRDEDSKFIPNVKNFAPRPAGWKVGKNKNYL
jgi:hypothetical protein